MILGYLHDFSETSHHSHIGHWKMKSSAAPQTSVTKYGRSGCQSLEAATAGGIAQGTRRIAATKKAAWNAMEWEGFI